MATNPAYKFTLSSGKSILIREPKIKDTRLCAQIAGKGTSDNQALLVVRMQEELLKILLVKVDDTEVSAIQKENLDDLFTVKEYGQALQCVQMVSDDGEDEGKFQPKPEIVASGQ
jgi:hypothetical protein